jgi:hypothetical protein
VTLGIVQNSPCTFRLNYAILSDGRYRRSQIGHFKKENRLIFRGVRFGSFPLQTHETRTSVELGMMSDLLVGNPKAQRLDVEFLSHLQIIEIEFERL